MRNPPPCPSVVLIRSGRCVSHSLPALARAHFTQECSNFKVRAVAGLSRLTWHHALPPCRTRGCSCTAGRRSAACGMMGTSCSASCPPPPPFRPSRSACGLPLPVEVGRQACCCWGVGRTARGYAREGAACVQKARRLRRIRPLHARHGVCLRQLRRSCPGPRVRLLCAHFSWSPSREPPPRPQATHGRVPQPVRRVHERRLEGAHGGRHVEACRGGEAWRPGSHWMWQGCACVVYRRQDVRHHARLQVLARCCASRTPPRLMAWRLWAP